VALAVAEALVIAAAAAGVEIEIGVVETGGAAGVIAGWSWWWKAGMV